MKNIQITSSGGIFLIHTVHIALQE